MAILTKYASFEALKRAENAATTTVVNREKLNSEVEQAANILSTLRRQQQQKNARKQ